MRNLAKKLILVSAVAQSSRMTTYRALAFAPTCTSLFRHRTGTDIRSSNFHSSRPSALSMMGDLTYGLRKASFGIEDKDVLKTVASSKSDNVVFVDVRNPDEIAEAQCSRPFVEGKFLLEGDCDATNVQKYLPNKQAPHIVYCAKGGRAQKACQKLKELGYSNVYNAGGLSDIDFLE